MENEGARRRARLVAEGKLTARKVSRDEFDQDREDIAYWLGRPVQERFAAVEILRRQRHGDEYWRDSRLRGPNAFVVKTVRKPRSTESNSTTGQEESTSS